MDLLMLPKDILATILVNMDLTTLVNLCLTNSEYNKRISQNNMFWLNKLIHDFEIITSRIEAKREYLRLDYLLRTDPEKVFREGMENRNLKKIQQAVNSGFDPTQPIEDTVAEYEFPVVYPLATAICYKDRGIFDYLSTVAITEQNSILIIHSILNLVPYAPGETIRDRGIWRVRIIQRLYSTILPLVSNYDKFKRRSFWLMVVKKLNEFHSKHGEYFPDEFYQKWIRFYEDLASGKSPQ